MSWLLQIVPLCMYLFEVLFSFFLGIHPEVELLDHMIVMFLVFWGHAILFSTVAAAFSIPTSRAHGFQSQYTLTSTCYFLLFLKIVAMLMGVRWYLITPEAYSSKSCNCLISILRSLARWQLIFL